MRLILIACLLLSAPSWLLAAPAGTADYNQWRSQQNDSHYAIQLIASASESRLPQSSTIAEVKAVNPEADVVYQRKHVKGKVWHALLWGPFDSPERALQANRGLPDALRNDSPWVRKIGSLPAQSASGSPAPAPKAARSGGLQGELAAMLLGDQATTATPPRRTAQAAPKRVRRPDDTSPREPKPAINTDGLSKSPRIRRADDHTPVRKYDKPMRLPPGNYSKKGWENSLAADDHPSEQGFDTYIPRQGTYPYARLDIGQLAFDSTPEAKGTQLHFNVGLDVGYYLGTELGYTSASGIKASGFAGEADLSGLEYSLLFKLPIDGKIYRQWVPYLQVGLFDWERESGGVTASDRDLFYGAGLDYKLNTHWAIGLRAKQYDFANTEAMATTVNISWRWEGRN